MGRSFTAASSQYLQALSPALSGFNAGIPFCTICCWFYPTANIQEGLVQVGGTNYGWGIRYISSLNNYGAFTGTDVGGFGEARSTAQVQNVWAHVAGVWYLNSSAQASIDLYINGLKVKTDLGTSGTTTVNRTAIGAFWNGAGYQDYATGYIAEAAIWNTPLTSAELYLLGKEALSPLALVTRQANLKGYWPLQGGNGNTELDLSNGHRSLFGVNVPPRGPHPFIQPYARRFQAERFAPAAAPAATARSFAVIVG